MTRRYKRAAILLVLLTLWVGTAGQPRQDVPTESTASAASPPAEPYSGTRLPVRWGFYITYNPNSWTSLQANAKNLNYVSPWFYYVNKEGQVTGKDDPKVSRLLREVGAKNLPMVQNSAQYNDFTSVLTDTNKQVAIIDQLDALVTANGYDGITIDFEWVNAADKGMLTTFMGRLSERFKPKGKLVAMAVAAKSTDTTSGWSAPYDYNALGKIVDYMLVMAYDYHWSTSAPGPVAPINKLREAAAYTVSRVPANKVIWGVGVYGYDWERTGVPAPTSSAGSPTPTATPSFTPTSTNTPVGTATPTPSGTRTATPSATPTGKAEYRNHGEAIAASKTGGAKSGYDTTTESPWVIYYRDGWQREIWYENRRSFDAKLGLIEKYGMAGFGIWRLGQEDPKIWETVASAGPPAACKPIKQFAPTATKVYFPETRHSLGGPFLRHWREKGGLAIFGYPLTEEFTETSQTNGKRYKVQYFERNRFEYHPENKPPNDVLLGLLGVQVAGNRTFPPALDPATGPEIVFFPQVQHTLGGPFFKHWQEYGGLGQFGYPISEPIMEQSSINGRTYMVQYMQRARFELHPAPDQQPDTMVLLGLLGLDVLPCRD